MSVLFHLVVLELDLLLHVVLVALYGADALVILLAQGLDLGLFVIDKVLDERAMHPSSLSYLR